MKNRTLKQSFANAFVGLRESIQAERNFRIHLIAIILVILAGLLLRIDSLRWGLLTLASGAVLATELLNTALERLVDMVTQEHCEPARQVKDMAAAAVLVATVFAVLCGVAVFIGPLLAWLNI